MTRRSPRIAVCDYGVGNMRSVERALTHAGATVAVTAEATEITSADGVVLPGVGAFGAALDALEARGLREVLGAAVAGGRPMLGVCLGFQLLFERSEESDDRPGLGLLPGRIVRIAGARGKVPHMGWNRLRIRRDDPLLAGVPDGAHCYFVHSYQAESVDPGALVADCDYAGTVPAVVRHGRVWGTQFHPEKSSAAGLRMYANFAALCAA